MQTSGTNSEHLFTVDTIVWLNIRSFNVEKRPTLECLFQSRTFLDVKWTNIQSHNRQNSKDSITVNCQELQWPALISHCNQSSVLGVD